MVRPKNQILNVELFIGGKKKNRKEFSREQKFSFQADPNFPARRFE